MPYISFVRSDIPEGVLQITDLKPNATQRNLTYEKEESVQTGYHSYTAQNDDPTNSVSASLVHANETVTVVGTIADSDAFTVDAVANALSAAGETLICKDVPASVYPAIHFLRAAGDAATTAANLVTAINAESRVVWASALGAVVTLTARVAGTTGNAVDLVATVEGGGPGTAFTLGGATLANGTSGNVTTSATINGLRAYLLDRVSNAFLSIGSGGTLQCSPLTVAEATTIATDIIAKRDAGTALTLTEINLSINTPTTVSGSDLDGTDPLSQSTGSVSEVLRILAGESFTLASAYNVANNTGNKVVFNSAANGGAFAASSRVRYIQNTGAFKLSVAEGVLSKMTSASFTYLGVTGRAVSVYADDGSVIV